MNFTIGMAKYLFMYAKIFTSNKRRDGIEKCQSIGLAA